MEFVRKGGTELKKKAVKYVYLFVQIFLNDAIYYRNIGNSPTIPTTED